MPLNRTKRDEPGKCLLSGVCQEGGKGDDNRGYVPCVSESDHHKFSGDAAAYQVLKEECAELFADSGDQPEVCCNADELMAIQSSISVMTKFLSDCPSCAANFREIYCHFSCAPNQNEFIQIVESVPSTIPGKEMISIMNYYVDGTFIQALWDSCKSSQIAQTFTRMGSGCEKNCTVHDFLLAISKPSPTTPYSLNMITSGAKGYIPATLTPRTCNDGCDAKCGVESFEKS